jgi:hypothetical protein
MVWKIGLLTATIYLPLKEDKRRLRAKSLRVAGCLIATSGTYLNSLFLASAKIYPYGPMDKVLGFEPRDAGSIPAKGAGQYANGEASCL